jgi:protein arginine kinase
VISSRVRLARNLKNFSLPSCASEKELHIVGDSVSHAVHASSCLYNATILFLHELTPLERRVLEETSQISPLLANQSKYRLAVISPHNSKGSILVNEEDHLRIQAIQPGFNLRKAWKTVKKLDICLQEKLDFAHTQRYGYVTACPSNAGSGMRPSVRIFVPALIMLKRIIPLIKQWIAEGYTVRGASGEGSESQGYILQISNQRPDEKNEGCLLQNLEQLCHNIIEQEKKARLYLLKTHKKDILETMTQAVYELQTMPKMSLNRGIKNLAIYRLGIALGMISDRSGVMKKLRQERDQKLKRVDRLMVSIQPGHIHKYRIQHPQFSFLEPGSRENREEEETNRAKLIQRELAICD